MVTCGSGLSAAASISGVAPAALRSFTRAPLFRSSESTAGFVLEVAAAISGVSPSLSRALTSAPGSMSAATHFRPGVGAGRQRVSAVHPCVSWSSTRAPGRHEQGDHPRAHGEPRGVHEDGLSPRVAGVHVGARAESAAWTWPGVPLSARSKMSCEKRSAGNARAMKVTAIFFMPPPVEGIRLCARHKICIYLRQ